MMAGHAVNADENYVQTLGVQLKSEASTTNNRSGSSHHPKLCGIQQNLAFFERCTGGLLNLRFDSDVLENFYMECALVQSRGRFRCAMGYISFVSATWLIYFGINTVPFWGAYVGGCAVGFILSILFLLITLPTIWGCKRLVWLSPLSSALFCILALLTFGLSVPPVSLVFNLGLMVQLVLLMYVMIPLRLWQALTLSSLLSLTYLLLATFHYGLNGWRFLVTHILMHSGVHFVGIIVHLMAQTRRRSTFLRLGKNALIRQQIRVEQQVKNDMIRSLMPDKVAQEVMKDEEDERKGSRADAEWESGGDVKAKRSRQRRSSCGASETEEEEEGGDIVGEKTAPMKENGVSNDLEALSSQSSVFNAANLRPAREVTFRKFHVDQMPNVSILFADIVGFTKMCGKKSATELVFLLNDLFGRFDSLCELTGCEKIATLGDCYYCVAGCPNPVPDHAERTVEMGRGMCHAIREFDEQYDEDVNMRVGVHTGTVICGLVGTRRFKFDVWSNDVTLANLMESTGKPGMVHLSECTVAFVRSVYEVTEGDPVHDIRKFKVLVEFFDPKKQMYAIRNTQDEAMLQTYFVVRRLDDKPPVILPPRESDTSARTVTDDDLDDEDRTRKLSDICVTLPLRSSTGTPSTAGALATCKPLLLPPLQEATNFTDIDLVEHLRAESTPERVFYFPPISKFTLRFYDRALEIRYRHLGLHRPKTKELTWATPRITPLINMMAQTAFFILTICICFIAFPYRSAIGLHDQLPFLLVAVTAFSIKLIFSLHLLCDFFLWTNASARLENLYIKLYKWYPRNIVGAFIVGLPSALVLSNFHPASFEPTTQAYMTMFGSMTVFMLCNYLLFTMYSSWTKSLTATVATAVALVLLYTSELTTDRSAIFYNESMQLPQAYTNTSLFGNLPLWLSDLRRIEWEMTVSLLLTLSLVWFFNREFEISFRSIFNCDHQAIVAKETVAKEKRQADWLLENIIPKFLIDELKAKKKCSQHCNDAGVIFATIANFDDFYDEQYEGGREMLRVLNEIFADFEKLLTFPKYKDVEKIKTIGACFMAASGLNLIERDRNRLRRPDAHLHSLMDFSFDLIRTLEEFNRNILCFNFELKIGYNIGDVKGGVIGTSKLLFDIWGDTVNVASRMYSTGQKGQIQVPEDVARRLEDRYEFEYRGQVEVKGKGPMNTYLVVRKKART